MMRKLAFAAFVGTAAASKEDMVVKPSRRSGQQLQCAINGEEVIADTMDSVFDIWAASKRCEASSVEKAPVFCEMDVTASIQSVIKMSRAMTGLVTGCDKALKVDACGGHVGHLLEMMAGLAKAGGKIDEWCGADKYPWSSHPERKKPVQRATNLGKCILNTVGTLDSMDKVNKAVEGIKKKCDNGGKWCALQGMDVMTSISALGAYLAGAVGRCSAIEPDGKTNWHGKNAAVRRPSVCASAIQEAVAYLGGIGQLGIVLEHSCGEHDERLYLDSENSQSAATSPLILALAAALPMTAVASFVAGTRLSKARQTRQVAAVPSEDAELLESQEQ